MRSGDKAFAQGNFERRNGGSRGLACGTGIASHLLQMGEDVIRRTGTTNQRQFFRRRLTSGLSFAMPRIGAMKA